jgi:hypothetical protein
MLGDGAPDNEDEDLYDDDGDDDEMEDVPPADVKLEALITDDYDEDAATATTLAASEADEEAKYSWSQGWRTSSSSQPWWRIT